MNPCSMAYNGADVANRNWLCPGCSYPKIGQTAIDVTLQTPGPQHGPLSLVYGFGIPLATRKFLESFDDAVVDDLYLGRVFLDNGKQLSDWVTFRGKSRLIIRGTKNVSYRVCRECKRNVYFAMGCRYLFPSPPSERKLFESDLSGLIVSQEMFDRIALNKWPGLVFDKICVLASPKDNLLDLQTFYAGQ